MIGTALGLAGLVAVAWLALIGLLALQERRLIFFPTRHLSTDPAAYGLDAEELSVTTSDGEALHGWWITGPTNRVLIWYHGNAGNIGDRLHNARWFVERLGVDVVLVDYRGYGRSQGTPDEAGLYLDGLAILDAVVDRAVRPEDVVLFGRSLGGAVAIEVALRRRVGAVALESVFRSVRALARVHYWFVPSGVVRTRMDNEAKIGRVTTATLFLHGDRDTVVPIAHGRRLFELAPPPTRFHVVEGAGHNDTYLVGGSPYVEAWSDFLRHTAARPGARAYSGAATSVAATAAPRRAG